MDSMGDEANHGGHYADSRSVPKLIALGHLESTAMSSPYLAVTCSLSGRCMMSRLFFEARGFFLCQTQGVAGSSGVLTPGDLPSVSLSDLHRDIPYADTRIQ